MSENQVKFSPPRALHFGAIAAQKRTHMNRRLTAVMIVVSLVLAGAPAFSARHDQCDAIVADRLAELDIGLEDVRTVTYVQDSASVGRSGIISRGVKAWVELKSCKGSVVMDINDRCRIKQTYTRGGCRIPGVKNY